MAETHFYGHDMAGIIEHFRPELHDQFAELYPSIQRRMADILAHPERHVNLRTADAIVTAMGCPHVLANGAVRVVEGYHRKLTEPMASVAIPGVEIQARMLPAAPFRKWLERQSRHYTTLTSMYNDLDLEMHQGSSIWRGTAKQVHSHTVEAAASRRGVHIDSIYPNFNMNGKVI